METAHEGKERACLPDRRETSSSRGCPTSGVCLRSRRLRSLRERPWVSELLLINLLTSLLLAPQQAFVVQAEPFTPHQRKSLALSPQTELLHICHQGDPAGRACLAEAEWGRGRGFSLVISVRDKTGVTDPASWGASLTHSVWEPGPPWPRTGLHAVCPLSSSGTSYHRGNDLIQIGVGIL